MAVTPLFKEYHHEQKVPYFIEYVKRYTDSPFLVVLEKKNGIFQAGKMLRANQINKYKDAEAGDWKFLNIDKNTGDGAGRKSGHVGDRDGTGMKVDGNRG